MYTIPPDLWPPQRRGLEATLDAIERAKHVCYYGPTGSGKTRVFQELAHWCVSRGMRALFYLNRRLLISQTAERFRAAGLPFGIRAADYEDQEDFSAPVQICSADTEWSRVYERKIWNPIEAEVVGVDECLPRGTDVGGIPIEDVLPGCLVPCYDHQSGQVTNGLVIATSVRKTARIVLIEFRSGEKLACTPHHPIWVESEGRYIAAIAVLVNDEILRNVARDETPSDSAKTHLYGLRGRIYDNSSETGEWKELLQRGVREGPPKATDIRQPGCPGVALDQNEEPQSDGHAGGAGEGVSRTESQGTQTFSPGRERPGADQTRTRYSDGLGVEVRSSCCDGEASGLSAPLQGGRWTDGEQGRNRSGRAESQFSQAKGTGQKETGVLRRDRVARVSVYKQAGGRKFERLCPRGLVYNLEVARFGNYFANGALVHNCHLQKATTMTRILDDHKARGGTVVGFTATPIGVSHLVDELIVSGTLAEYRECKAIVPAIVRSIEQPDMNKVQRNKTGEYVWKGEKRRVYTQTIVGHVLERWKKYNPDARPTLLYAPGVAESVWFTEQFRKAGVNWCHVDATDAVVEGIRAKLTRTLWEEIKERYISGDIKGISSRMKLREGVDFPETAHVILATPMGSMATYLQTIGRGLRWSPSTPNHVVVQDHGGCLDTDTEVLTKRGWVGHLQISRDDLVAGYNLQTGEITWEAIKSTHVRTLTDGERMCSVQSRCLDLRVTGTHRLIVKRRQSAPGGETRWPSEFRFETATEAAERSGRFKIPVAGLQAAPGVRLSDAEIEFLGWWITDGCLYRGRNSTRKTLTIAQAAHRQYIHVLRDCLMRCGFDWKETEQKYRDGSGRICVCFHVPQGTSLSRPRRGWSRLEPYLDKDLSPLLEEMDERQFGIFLHAVHMGDGSKAKGDGSYSICSGSKTFADRLQSLCVRRGWKCNVATRIGQRKRPLYILQIVKTKEGCLHGSATRTRDRQAKLSVQIPPCGTKVWCVSNRMETIIVRRNGRVAIVGNSYLRLGSPNHDRPWRDWWNLSESAISRMPMERIREGKAPEPIRCPQCEGERVGGMTCPHCGFVHEKSKRHVIMADGRMRIREGKLIRKKYVSERPETQRHWDSMYFGYKRKRHKATFSQMEAFFLRTHGYYPPRTLVNMPRHPEDWHARVCDVPFNRLIQKADKQKELGLTG